MIEIIEKDVVIIGGGPAGLTSALYTSRANLDTAIIEQGVTGGQLNNTETVENYIGAGVLTGAELAEKMSEDAVRFGAEEFMGTVESVEYLDNGEKYVKTDKQLFKTKAVILAMGASHKKLGIKGEDTYYGSGVSNCAICDGVFFSGQHVTVVGGGDSAFEEALYLSDIAEQVTIIHRRDEFRAQQVIQDRVFEKENINILTNATVTEVIGDGQNVTGVRVQNVHNVDDEHILDTNGVFIYIGMEPNSVPVEGIREGEWINTNETMETNLKGIFAVGDIRQKELRQVANAVGDGAIAGQQAYKYISSNWR